MSIWVGVAGLAVSLVYLLVWALCVTAAEADRLIEEPADDEPDWNWP